MKTPFGIHAEYVSERAVNNCVNMYKKDAHKIVPGKIGRNQDVIPEYKDSLDCPIDIKEIKRLKIWHKEMHDVIDNYICKFPILRQHQPWGYVDGINIQYYKPGGGYPAEHCEIMSYSTSHRIMAFMTYLTDTKNGGTEFTYLNWKAPCKKGLTLIWPANYIYAHKGVISKTEDKMIITGWLGFKKDEQNE
jgi:hypothetical protein